MPHQTSRTFSSNISPVATTGTPSRSLISWVRPPGSVEPRECRTIDYGSDWADLNSIDKTPQIAFHRLTEIASASPLALLSASRGRAWRPHEWFAALLDLFGRLQEACDGQTHEPNLVARPIPIGQNCSRIPFRGPRRLQRVGASFFADSGSNPISRSQRPGIYLVPSHWLAPGFHDRRRGKAYPERRLKSGMQSNFSESTAAIKAP
jgi:hypothetical protein